MGTKGISWLLQKMWANTEHLCNRNNIRGDSITHETICVITAVHIILNAAFSSAAQLLAGWISVEDLAKND